MARGKDGVCQGPVVSHKNSILKVSAKEPLAAVAVTGICQYRYRNPTPSPRSGAGNTVTGIPNTIRFVCSFVFFFLGWRTLNLLT